MPLNKVREWLELQGDGRQTTLAHFDGDEWTDSILPDELGANSVIVLPTSTKPQLLEELIPRGGDKDESQRCWDVFEALSEQGAKYLRSVTTNSPQIKTGHKVYRVPDLGTDSESSELANDDEDTPIEKLSDTIDLKKWKPARIKLLFSSNGITFELRYFKPCQSDGTILDLLPGHLAGAAKHGKRLAQALFPDNKTIAALLALTGEKHDIGKNQLKWQQSMGNTRTWRQAEGHEDSIRIAKPVIENPPSSGGYRHEWGTLWAIKGDLNLFVVGLDKETADFLGDCHLHSIAAHHGYFRPSMPDRGFDSPPTAAKQNPLRLESIERSARLQRQLGYWRLAYLESLIKVADVGASRDAETEDAVDEF